MVFKEVSLIKNPIVTISTITIIITEKVLALIKYLITNIPILLTLAMYSCLNFIPNPLTDQVNYFNKIGWSCLYWLILGVASSIGLGTGLHTFVLYLGPHIAKITLASNECSYFPEMNPNRWEFKDFLPCTVPATEANFVSFWTILFNVQLEAFMWGLGTAIGELPPYFMARGAAQAGKSNEELEEIEAAEKEKTKSFMDNVKIFIYEHLKRHGFVTVLLCASIPNPLFDLAGITCGHFGIAFWTFFGATMIGKAIFKVHIQTIFVILAFSKHHVESILSILESYIPAFHSILSTALEKQKKSLFHGNSQNLDENKPLIAILWEGFIILMVVYFLYSIVNSLVNERLKENENNKSKNK